MVTPERLKCVAVATALLLVTTAASCDSMRRSECEGRGAVVFDQAVGKLTIWRDTKEGEIYFIPWLNSADEAAEKNVTAIKGRILLRGGPFPHDVGGVKFEDRRLLSESLPGGLPLLKKLEEKTVDAKCGAAPPPIAAFRRDEAHAGAPGVEIYGSAVRAQRHSPWPIVWAGHKLAGLPLHLIELERSPSGVRSITVNYRLGSKTLGLVEVNAHSTWAAGAETQLAKGFQIGTDRRLDVAHGQPMAEVGRTIVALASDHPRSRSQWIAIVRALHPVGG